MAHYAFIENNIVTEVITGIDENELIEGLDPETWYGNFRNQKCVRTSYNANIRFNYAQIGDSYDPIDDAFIAPMLKCGHDELTLNEVKRWECSNPEHDIRPIDELNE
tara:strand:+ start:154 stop:474 length:321 start_codon:yes stop_codon:yes gene_type:complete